MNNEKWYFYIVCVFGNDDKIVHFMNNIDELSDAIAQADICKKRYDETYSIEIFRVDFSLADKQYGVKPKNYI